MHLVNFDTGRFKNWSVITRGLRFTVTNNNTYAVTGTYFVGHERLESIVFLDTVRIDTKLKSVFLRELIEYCRFKIAIQRKPAGYFDELRHFRLIKHKVGSEGANIIGATLVEDFKNPPRTVRHRHQLLVALTQKINAYMFNDLVQG